MRGSFAKGLLIGSIIGASMGMMMDNGDVRKSKRRMVRNGRNMIKNSSDLVNDVMSLFK